LPLKRFHHQVLEKAAPPTGEMYKDLEIASLWEQRRLGEAASLL